MDADIGHHLCVILLPVRPCAKSHALEQNQKTIRLRMIVDCVNMTVVDRHDVGSAMLVEKCNVGR